ncbi:hypothetical protein TNCT_409671 [Trichonephila clavata]|uniref:Uncharacterized protein n=1 Tax=Trichonephila clavata TaxID=2740835 RepID=A0A8X6F724_TRICU|nr:hypothetical protein TNCT_409671 [Trichonephila clavata]
MYLRFSAITETSLLSKTTLDSVQLCAGDLPGSLPRSVYSSEEFLNTLARHLNVDPSRLQEFLDSNTYSRISVR